MDWKGVGIVGAWAAVAVALSLWLGSLVSTPSSVAPVTPAADATEENRVVSLSAAITETLFVLGAGELVVGRTDHCLYPPSVLEVASVGPGLSPDLEGIAKRRPSMILTHGGAAMDSSSLSAIAPTESLPWLTLNDVISSTEKVGLLVGRTPEAANLVVKLREELGRKAPKNAPTVLLLLGADPKAGSLWYVRTNSLHGRALEAAGGRNAMPDPTDGAPELSLEGLMKVNPEVIIALADGPALSKERIDAFKSRFNAFPGLKAAKSGRIRVISRPGAMSMGPRILDLIPDLRAALASMRDEVSR